MLKLPSSGCGRTRRCRPPDGDRLHAELVGPEGVRDVERGDVELDRRVVRQLEVTGLDVGDGRGSQPEVPAAVRADLLPGAVQEGRLRLAPPPPAPVEGLRDRDPDLRRRKRGHAAGRPASARPRLAAGGRSGARSRAGRDRLAMRAVHVARVRADRRGLRQRLRRMLWLETVLAQSLRGSPDGQLPRAAASTARAGTHRGTVSGGVGGHHGHGLGHVHTFPAPRARSGLSTRPGWSPRPKMTGGAEVMERHLSRRASYLSARRAELGWAIFTGRVR